MTSSLAARLARSRFAPRSVRVARALDDAAHAVANGELDVAVARASSVLEWTEASAPQRIPAEFTLSVALASRGELAAALPHAEQALALGVAHPAACEPPLAHVMLHTARLAQALGHDARALTLFRDVVAGLDRVREPQPVELEEALTRAGLLAAKSSPDEAARLLARALEVAERAVPGRLAEALFNAATWPLPSEPAPVRRARLERALSLGPAPSLRARVLHNLGAVLEGEGDTASAVARYAEALAAIEAEAGPNAPELRPTLVRLAHLHLGEGLTLLAASLFARALELARGALGERHEVTRAIAGWLGELTGP